MYIDTGNGPGEIICASGLSRDDCISTIAHELVHRHLDHSGNQLRMRELGGDMGRELVDRQEREANEFAEALLGEAFRPPGQHGVARAQLRRSRGPAG